MKRREWLIKIRGEVTQESIALDAGISRALYTQIETGARNPSVFTAKKIAEVLNFDWTYFFDENCNDMAQREVM